MITLNFKHSLATRLKKALVEWLIVSRDQFIGILGSAPKAIVQMIVTGSTIFGCLMYLGMIVLKAPVSREVQVQDWIVFGLHIPLAQNLLGLLSVVSVVGLMIYVANHRIVCSLLDKLELGNYNQPLRKNAWLIVCIIIPMCLHELRPFFPSISDILSPTIALYKNSWVYILDYYQPIWAEHVNGGYVFIQSHLPFLPTLESLQ